MEAKCRRGSSGASPDATAPARWISRTRRRLTPSCAYLTRSAIKGRQCVLETELTDVVELFQNCHRPFKSPPSPPHRVCSSPRFEREICAVTRVPASVRGPEKIRFARLC